MKKELQLYIHIPFCKSKCQYCDFLSFSSDAEEIERYVTMLMREIEREETEGYIVTSVFFGGGTPSLLDGQYIRDILDVCRRKYSFTDDAEITLEANPGTLDFEKLSYYKKAGINRLSMGLQSANNEELKQLGRIHTWEEFHSGYELARTCGFTNINVDMMSALPGQTVASWQHSLQQVLQLQPEHISAYSLIIEEGTPFYERYAKDDEKRIAGEANTDLPSEEAEREMYYLTQRLLKEFGYDRYEVSNYAKPGYECRHNIGYWRRREYRGFGLGASSLMAERRFQVTEKMADYLKGDFRHLSEEVLDRQAQMEEMMFLGLRLGDGVSEDTFSEKFGCTFDRVYGKVCDKLKRDGLLEKKENCWRLTEKGMDLSNYVFAQFLIDG